MSYKDKDQKEKGVGTGYQHMDSFDRNIQRPGAMEGHGDQIVASIQAPHDTDKRKSRDNSLGKIKSSDKDGMLEDSRDERKLSHFQDANATVENKKKDTNNFNRQDRPAAHQSRREEVGQSRNQSNSTSQRTFWQKCPNWLKLLMLLLTLVALGGLVYWFMFKRGKTQALNIHKKGEVVKTEQIVVKPGQHIPKKGTAPIVVANKTVTESVVKQKDQSKNNSTKQVVSVQRHPQQSKQGIKKETTTVVTKQQKPEDISQNQSAGASTIIVPKGNRTFCPDTQFLLNGNCMSCPPGMTWSGLNCMMNSAAKHLKRVQL